MAKHILLISVGRSPAVITETVYALGKAKEKANDLPDKVVVITTSTGKDEIMKQLFGADHVWETMLEENDWGGKVRFGDADIIIIPDEKSNLSADIISSSDNNELADKMLEILRIYTENPDTRISFSIAGGRKSMSAVGALVMALLGRRQDKMYHILVSDPFENPNLEPRFYYPRNIEHKLNDKPHCGNNAQLQLSEVPFIKCRYWFYDKGIDIKDYSDLVKEINTAQLEVTIDTFSKKISVNDKEINCSYLEFCLYHMLIERYLDEYDDLEHGDDDLVEVFKDFIKKQKINIVNTKSVERKGQRNKNLAEYQLNLKALRKALSAINCKMEKIDQRLRISKKQNRWGINPSILRENIIVL